MDKGSKKRFMCLSNKDKIKHTLLVPCVFSWYVFVFVFCSGVGGISFSWCLSSHSVLIHINRGQTKLLLLQARLNEIKNEGEHHFLWSEVVSFSPNLRMQYLDRDVARWWNTCLACAPPWILSPVLWNRKKKMESIYGSCGDRLYGCSYFAHIQIFQDLGSSKEMACVIHYWPVPVI